MDNYVSIKQQIVNITQNTAQLIDQIDSVSQLSPDALSEWKKSLAGIETQVAEDMIRVAVVGAIKSGKSTIVNALFQGDYTKRGAGVVTSIVTRIRNGPALKACLQFKSWDEINAELEQALVLFPSMGVNSGKKPFDIRRLRDRQVLEEGLASLAGDQLITNDTRNVNSVLLFSYSKGYERVKEIVQPESACREFDALRFGDHREFVGNDSLAVYLRDIRLEIAGDTFDSGLEIADCQGSDSPNPLHLSMIQDYLALTHLLIYVISSRTGVRQADIRFLSMIKKMGIIDNTLFVVNADFNEHDTPQDLQILVKKVTEELGFIIDAPRVYTFSGLYNLFRQTLDTLGPKDRARFTQWESEDRLVALNREESERFQADFLEKITSQRSTLMIDNHLERLRLLVDGLKRIIGLNREMLTEDADGARDLGRRVSHHQESVARIRSMAKSTIDGAVLALKRELKNDADRFFDLHSGHIIKSSIDFIRSHPIDLQSYRESVAVAGFANTLYQVFQEFKQAIDTFMAHSINPEVIRFIKEAERKIQSQLTAVVDPYNLMVEEAFVAHGFESAKQDPKGRNQAPKNGDSIHLDGIKGLIGLSVPPARAAMHYSANIKADAIIRLGVYSAVGLIKRIFRRDQNQSGNSQVAALGDGVRRMRRETEKSIVANFKNHRENIKFQYLLKLADGAGAELHRGLQARLGSFDADLGNMMQLAEKTQADKAALNRKFKELEAAVEAIGQRLAGIRDGLDCLSN